MECSLAITMWGTVKIMVVSDNSTPDTAPYSLGAQTRDSERPYFGQAPMCYCDCYDSSYQLRCSLMPGTKKPVPPLRGNRPCSEWRLLWAGHVLAAGSPVLPAAALDGARFRAARDRVLVQGIPCGRQSRGEGRLEDLALVNFVNPKKPPKSLKPQA